MKPGDNIIIFLYRKWISNPVHGGYWTNIILKARYMEHFYDFTNELEAE